jgi:hypothetical protein
MLLTNISPEGILHRVDNTFVNYRSPLVPRKKNILSSSNNHIISGDRQ